MTYPFGNDGRGFTTEDLSPDTEGQDPKLGKGAISVAANWDSTPVVATPIPRLAASSTGNPEAPEAFEDDRSILCGTPGAMESSLVDPDITVETTVGR